MGLITIPAAAEQLGLKPATIRDWIYQRKIPFVRLGRSIRLTEETIRALIEKGTVPARRHN
jgi:excisionase family DNA binding protein